MESNIAVICPKCRKVQEETIVDLLDVGDYEGEFPHTCDSCLVNFVVVVEVIPKVTTYLREDEA